MLVPLKWLKDYVDIKADANTFADAMTMSGSKVEAVEEMGKDITNVAVGKITKTEKHPDADKLTICQVDVGTETIQIVTGATNIKEGDYIPVALVGANLPGGVKIKKGKLRGVESSGMMCSAQELSLPLENLPEEQQHGIYILEQGLPLGKDVKEILGLNDVVVEFEITNNRPDCLSIIGIAREAAATFGEKLNLPHIEVKENNENIKDYVSIEVKNTEKCPRYASRVVKNVKIQESPAWMQDKLTKAGVRPINNIVDITNFVMMEMGQPMHAFDLAKLEGGQIIVRNAEKDEAITTLDEVERKLDESMLVIADGKRAIAIAGVMGSSNSEIDETTKTLVFECANFEPINTRLTSKRLGLRTEASSRFEKGVDVELIDMALDRACQLIQLLEAGEVVGGKIDLYPAKKEKRRLKLRGERVRSFIGADISDAQIKSSLETLGFEITGEGVFEVAVPTFRDDVEGEADIIEEIVRIYGYDNIPSTLMDTTFTLGGKSDRQNIVEAAKNIMTAQGLYETLTYSFVSPNGLNKINLKEESPLRNAIRIINPLGEEHSIMRTTMMPNMLEVIAKNYSKKIEEGQFFELSRIYLTEKLPLEDIADERETLTAAIYGKVDFYDLKGIIENLLDELNVPKYKFQTGSHESFHPGRTAELLINNKVVGYLGEVHPDALDNYDIPVRVYMAELNFEEIIKNVKSNIKYKTLPKYPAVSRDIALVVAEEITAGQIEDVIRSKGGKLVESVGLFDVYRGSQVEKGYKSMAYSIVYRSEEKTLTEEDVTKVHDKILSSLAHQVGAELRK